MRKIYWENIIIPIVITIFLLSLFHLYGNLRHLRTKASEVSQTQSYYSEKIVELYKTRLVLDRFHDSSRVVLLICLNLHSVLNAEKVYKSMRKCAKS